VADRAAEPTAPASPVSVGAAGASRPRTAGRKRFGILTRRDKVVLGLMVGIPTFMVLFFIALPTLLSILLGFSTWNGIGIDRIQWVGLRNYERIAENDQFWSAITFNVLWLGFFMFVATPIGILFAVILDRKIRGTRFYQGALYMPVVLSLAIVGFIWQLQYSPTQGFINGVLGTNQQGNLIDWIGNRDLNRWAILIAASWRQVGYVMILYLAGLKALDPSLREAAQIDGANERQTFFRVVFPVLAPINVIIIVITAIESLRAFDLVYITNRGINGLELLSVLITNTILGESSRVGYGSALAVILLFVSVGPVLIFLNRAWKAQRA
jgi:multiple sugar transport system permease protein/raffinose/stachyose/melibiose transport system permease protein